MSTGKIKFFNGTKGFGFIQGDDGKEVFVHIRNIKGGVIPTPGDVVTYKERQGNKGLEAADVVVAGARQSAPSATNQAVQLPGAFPYAFVPRTGGKQATENFHHQLGNDRLDVAFEVIWTTETPTALMPCEDFSLPASAVNRDGENIGYNKRWLMINGRPAISPFTVKGAVAGGVANLLGGCFRVPDREEGHNSSINAGTYPYTGKWKRYRVSMNGRSLPGIIREIDPATGWVKVQPVIEYYWDQPSIGFDLKPGENCYAVSHEERRRKLIDRLTKQALPPGQGVRVTYYGPYRFGMNLLLMPGDLKKNHHHRFYEAKGTEISGIVPKLAFATQDKLLKKVYGGQYCKNDPTELKAQRMRDHLGQPWYDDPASLQPGDWCYYTAFNDEDGKKRITAIGKNFQFKALFNHEDTIPSGNKTCTDMKILCPRCSLFGLADKSEGNGKESVGYAGRFRASTLIAGVTVTEKKFNGSIPAKETLAAQTVQYSSWYDGDRLVARQYALPIMGAPKPSKRDLDGYFDDKTGAVKGAKRYHHAELDFAKKLPDLIAHTDRLKKVEGEMDYGQQMRPVAAVIQEGVAFTGTIGGENCSSEEVAALLMLLDKRSADHAFKLGLGKSIGMGSVSSRISKLWVRKPASYQWACVAVPDVEGRKDLFAALKELVPEAVEELKQLINAEETLKKVHSLKGKKQRLSFAGAGLRYWQDAKVETV